MSKLNISEGVIVYNNTEGFSPSGSLTPRNNKSKQKLSFGEAEQGEDAEDSSPVGYIYTYSNKGLETSEQSLAEVKHYSIDPKAKEVQSSVQEFNKQLAKQKNDHSGTTKGSAGAKGNSSAGGKLEKNSKQQGSSNKTEESKIVYDGEKHLKAYKGDDVKDLHTCEIQLIKKAIETASSEKVALVDIFARHIEKEKFGKIKLVDSQNTGGSSEEMQMDDDALKELEIHTIILLKGSDNTTLVIDPNSSTFSSHIVYQYNQKYDGKLVAHTDLYKIYNSGVSKGKYINNARDCIDIAIKLAYKLKNIQEAIDFKPSKKEVFTSEEANCALKFISNSNKYDNIDDLVCDNNGFLIIPARLKQVTQEGYGKDFCDNELKVVKQLEMKRKAIENKLTNTLQKLEKSELTKKFESTFLEKEYEKVSSYQEARQSYCKQMVATYNKALGPDIALTEGINEDADCFTFSSLQPHTGAIDNFVELTGYESYMSNNQ